MSFRVIVAGRRFAIDGEFRAAVRAQQEMLRHSETGGGPLATRSLGVLVSAVDELLLTAPHDCDVRVDVGGEREADGTGAVSLKLTIAPHVAPPVEESKADTETAPTSTT
jgi:hypothetical protein